MKDIRDDNFIHLNSREGLCDRKVHVGHLQRRCQRGSPLRETRLSRLRMGKFPFLGVPRGASAIAENANLVFLSERSESVPSVSPILSPREETRLFYRCIFRSSRTFIFLITYKLLNYLIRNVKHLKHMISSCRLQCQHRARYPRLALSARRKCGSARLPSSMVYTLHRNAFLIQRYLFKILQIHTRFIYINFIILIFIINIIYINFLLDFYILLF